MTLRVLEVVSSFYPNVGGSETFTGELSSILTSKFGVECLVLHSERAGARDGERQHGSAKTVSFSPDFSLSTTPLALGWYRQTLNLLSDFNPDLVHASVPLPGLPDVVGWVARKKRIPFVLTYHNDIVGWNPVQSWMALCYNASLGRATRHGAAKIVVDAREYARSSAWLAPHQYKTLSILPGIADEFLRPSPRLTFDERGGDIVFIGRLEPGAAYKGLPILLKALRVLLNDLPALRLTVIGSGTWERKYRDAAERLHVGKAVTFMGGILRERLLSVLRTHKVLVLPSTSRAEGFGIVLVEAQSQGLPVVATKIGGLASAMIDGKTGALVSPHEPIPLANAIRKILSDSDLWSRFSERALEFSKGFSWERVAREYLSVFNDVLAESRGGTQTAIVRENPSKRID